MRNLAIIPARGGSKRIARKNIRPLAGTPVIGYPVKAALGCGIFTEVMVSTNDAEIAEIAGQHGATVPFLRSAATSDDYATLADVVTEVMNAYSAAGQQFDNICCILPTAALLSSPRILAGYKAFQNGNHKSLLPVVRFSYPIQRALRIESGILRLREPQFAVSRSQDLEPMYHDAAQFYWITCGSLLTEKTFFTEDTGYIELPETEVQDVDVESDWSLLELKFNMLKKETNA